MRLSLLPGLLFVALCSAREGDIHCHGRNSDDGKPCNFVDIQKEMDFYCTQVFVPRLVPVNDKVKWGYSKHLGGAAYNCPAFGNCELKQGIFMGWVRFDLNWGNLASPQDNWNAQSYPRCIEYMKTISDHCGGNGGSYETGYGEVFGICIKE
ncbi:hypothetical protein K491DRAFT_683112 [Lophiostoma macrostomum CBS 122681]|uniref:Ecp2 effector protein domain-containing protein n=1 Tax=Lophiostoma macrostomum CBS 122681 TaxID=1314788 RepID=A0A6A6SVP3_9PLEO|nr:hypothetical protein K491DRAFT_683112 [Lophiostoma macrostomum CBS 122681]